MGLVQIPKRCCGSALPAVGDDCIVASVRAPNQGYVTGNPATEEVGYNWGTRHHPELNIRLHHDIVRARRRPVSRPVHDSRAAHRAARILTAGGV
jgi:hypothetical protein